MSRLNKIINSIPGGRTKRPLRHIFALSSGDILPPATSTGYPKGHIFTLENATYGQSLTWINQGTEASSLFVPTGPVNGYGIMVAGARGATSGATTEIITGTSFSNTDVAFCGHIATDDTDFITSVAMTDDEGEMLITASADPLSAHGYMWCALRNKCTPEWDIFAAGTQVCSAAGSDAATSTGVLATDIAIANYNTTDDTDHITQTVCSANTVTATHSTTSSTGHDFSYMVLRQRGTFKPSHYIIGAGTEATVADGSSPYTNAITVSGAETTDLAFAVIQDNAGTLQVARAEVTATNTLTVEFDADPSTTSDVSYMVIRSY